MRRNLTQRTRLHRSVLIDLRRMALAPFVAAALASCGAPTATVHTEPGPAFVRIGSDLSVWYLPAGAATYCLVAEPTQMKVFGGFEHVKQLAAGTTIGDRKLEGTCPYPNGEYEVGGTVYLLRGDTMCREARSSSRATVLPAPTRVGVSRRDLGRCRAR